MAGSSYSVPPPNIPRDSCEECKLLRKELKKLTTDLIQRKEFIKVIVDALEDRFAEIHRLEGDKIVLEQRLAEQKAMMAKIHQKYWEALKWQQNAFEMIQERSKGLDDLVQKCLGRTTEELEKLE